MDQMWHLNVDFLTIYQICSFDQQQHKKSVVGTDSMKMSDVLVWFDKVPLELKPTQEWEKIYISSFLLEVKNSPLARRLAWA